MHGVVVIFGIGRIDGDQGQIAPILAAGNCRGLGSLRLRQDRAAEHVRDGMGVDRDQAHRSLAQERTELLRYPGVLEAIASPARCHLDGHQIAVLCIALGT